MAENNAPHGNHSGQSGHEERDVNIGLVVKVGAGVVALCVLSVVLLLGLFRYFQAQEAAKQLRSEGNAAQAKAEPPQPRLQTNEPVDLKQIRTSEDQILGTYGWVDRRKGIVRLPIARAMELLAQRGLPARREPGPQSAAASVSAPTDSGLGAKMIAPGGPLAGELSGK